MRALRVLLTNNALAQHAGSETYLRDVALSLLRRGHHPVAFSLVHGAVADELHRATIPVIDDLAHLGDVPDVIHGHHHLETLIAALSFPDVPIVHFCHGWIPWEEKPLRHPSIRQYVAVDEVCADRLIREEGIPADAVETLFNFVDLSRFRPRRPLPERPARALVFSNLATADGYVRHAAAACAALGITLDIVGLGAGNSVAAPERLLPQYDLVFAKARAAIEAMAVGCAVVLCDAIGAGPLVTPDNFDRLRAHNFGVRELQTPHDVEWYTQQIGAYNRCHAAAVRDRVRNEADLEDAVDRLVALYERAILSPPAAGDPDRATARHLRHVVLPLKEAWTLGPRLRLTEENVRLARAESDRFRAERDLIAAERDRMAAERDRIEAEIAAVNAVLTGRIHGLEASIREWETRGRELSEQQAAVASACDRALASLAETAAREQAGREKLDRLQAALASANERKLALERDVVGFRALRILRIRDAIRRLPVVGPGAHVAACLLVRMLKA